MLPVISEYDKEIMKQGIQQEQKRIIEIIDNLWKTKKMLTLDIMFMMDIKKELKQQIQSQETISTRKDAVIPREASPDTHSLQIIDNWLKSYPEDVFLKITPSLLKKASDFFMTNFGFPLDRLSAHILRDALIKIKQQIQSQETKLNCSRDNDNQSPDTRKGEEKKQ